MHVTRFRRIPGNNALKGPFMKPLVKRPFQGKGRRHGRRILVGVAREGNGGNIQGLCGRKDGIAIGIKITRGIHEDGSHNGGPRELCAVTDKTMKHIFNSGINDIEITWDQAMNRKLSFLFVDNSIF